jgi:hypothetical protein
VVSPDGVRCFVTRYQERNRRVPPTPTPDDLNTIPPFLRRDPRPDDDLPIAA